MVLEVLLMSTIFHRRHTAPPHLTAGALASLAEQEKSQLKAWYEEQHTHEQLVVGADTSRAGEKIEEFFKDIEENVGDKSK